MNNVGLQKSLIRFAIDLMNTVYKLSDIVSSYYSHVKSLEKKLYKRTGLDSDIRYLANILHVGARRKPILRVDLYIRGHRHVYEIDIGCFGVGLHNPLSTLVSALSSNALRNEFSEMVSRLSPRLGHIVMLFNNHNTLSYISRAYRVVHNTVSSLYDSSVYVDTHIVELKIPRGYADRIHFKSLSIYAPIYVKPTCTIGTRVETYSNTEFRFRLIVEIPGNPIFIGTTVTDYTKISFSGRYELMLSSIPRIIEVIYTYVLSTLYAMHGFLKDYGGE